MLRHIKGAIFDLDGTLLDSMGAWGEADRRFLSKRGIPLEQDYLDVVKTMFHTQAAPYTIERYGLDMTVDEVIAEWRESVDIAYERNIPAKSGAVEYVKALKNRGVAIAAATSTMPEHGTVALRRLGIYDLFDSITYTTEAARPKGHPDVYLLAAERLALPAADCAVFEDILVGVRAAKVGGFVSVAVYDDSSEAYWEAMKRESDMAITSFAELL